MVRNITGRIKISRTNELITEGSFQDGGEHSYLSGYSNSGKGQFIEFDANIDSSDYGNPMAGHATGDEVRPYAFLSIPLIAV